MKLTFLRIISSSDKYSRAIDLVLDYSITFFNRNKYIKFISY